MTGAKEEVVAVFMGGPSSEREISLRSGHSVASVLRGAGKTVQEVIVDEHGLFDWPETATVAFVAMHGKFGEDGQIQELLEARRLPHTGSSPEASARAFDKSKSKPVLVAAGVPTPAYECLRRGQPRHLPLPVVVKPVRQGSSVGVSRVFREEDWPTALETGFAYDQLLLVEEFIPGRELTVAIIGDETLPVVEIVAPNDNFDFTTKYAPNGARHLIPAPLPADVADRACNVARDTFRALGCSGMGRVDMRLREDGSVWVLELNNIPGLTPVSLVPDAARAYGWSFENLCLRILSQARLFT